MNVSGKLEFRHNQISEFWKACSLDNTFPTLSSYQSESNPFGDSMLGITFGNAVKDKDFPYAIGCLYTGEEAPDESFTIEEIPAHTFAVFTCVGTVAEAFPELCQRIFTEFFPTSDYQPCNGPDFEAYPSTDVTNPDYTCEIWVAVEKKKDN
jgi:AraC family transcriptional regulator